MSPDLGLNATFRRGIIASIISAGFATLAFVLVLIAAPTMSGWPVSVMASSALIGWISAALQYRHYRSRPTEPSTEDGQ